MFTAAATGPYPPVNHNTSANPATYGDTARHTRHGREFKATTSQRTNATPAPPLRRQPAFQPPARSPWRIALSPIGPLATLDYQ